MSLWLAGLLMLATSVQAQNSVQLSVVPKEGKDFTLKEVEQGVFEATTAPGNAIIEFAPLKSGELSDDIAVLSFDYFCASGMEFMVVMVNNDHSRIEENMIRMPIAEGWSTFSVDVTDKLKKMTGAKFRRIITFPTVAKPFWKHDQIFAVRISQIAVFEIVPYGRIRAVQQILIAPPAAVFLPHKIEGK